MKGAFLHDFRCGGRWRKYQRARNGIQQYRCTKCGLVKDQEVPKCWFFHQWKWDRRMPRGVLKCKKCATLKDTRSPEQIAAQKNKRQRTRTPRNART